MAGSRACTSAVYSTAGRELVVGFELANSTADRFDAVVGCFEAHGAAGCLHLGEVWRNSSLRSQPTAR